MMNDRILGVYEHCSMQNIDSSNESARFSIVCETSHKDIDQEDFEISHIGSLVKVRLFQISCTSSWTYSCYVLVASEKEKNE